MKVKQQQMIKMTLNENLNVDRYFLLYRNPIPIMYYKVSKETLQIIFTELFLFFSPENVDRNRASKINSLKCATFYTTYSRAFLFT